MRRMAICGGGQVVIADIINWDASNHAGVYPSVEFGITIPQLPQNNRIDYALEIQG